MLRHQYYPWVTPVNIKMLTSKKRIKNWLPLWQAMHRISTFTAPPLLSFILLSVLRHRERPEKILYFKDRPARLFFLLSLLCLLFLCYTLHAVIHNLSKSPRQHLTIPPLRLSALLQSYTYLLRVVFPFTPIHPTYLHSLYAVSRKTSDDVRKEVKLWIRTTMLRGHVKLWIIDDESCNDMKLLSCIPEVWCGGTLYLLNQPAPSSFNLLAHTDHNNTRDEMQAMNRYLTKNIKYCGPTDVVTLQADDLSTSLNCLLRTSPSLNCPNTTTVIYQKSTSKAETSLNYSRSMIPSLNFRHMLKT